MRSSYLATALAMIVVLFVAACGNAAVPSPLPSPTGPPAKDVEIYSTVVRRVAGPDDTFGGNLQKPVIYIPRTTNDKAGDPLTPASDPVILSQVLQMNIAAQLADLPSRIVWVDSRDQVGFDEPGGFAKDKGVHITLGNIRFEGDRKAFVPASIYVALLAAGGRTYVVEEAAGKWTITGTTGTMWMS